MLTLNDLCAHLLPADVHLKFKTLRINGPHLILAAAMQSPKAACPDCRQLSDRIHSSYWRTLADLPWSSAPIELRLNVRRFFCLTCTCARQTFTERLPSVAPLYARTTTRLATAQANTGIALGGAAGARHLTCQGAAVSRQTLLRRVQRLPLSECAAPQVIDLMIGPGAKAITTAPSSLIWNVVVPLMFWRTGPLKPWRPGFRPIRRSRW